MDMPMLITLVDHMKEKVVGIMELFDEIYKIVGRLPEPTKPADPPATSPLSPKNRDEVWKAMVAGVGQTAAEGAWSGICNALGIRDTKTLDTDAPMFARFVELTKRYYGQKAGGG
jgi:hypothetical protein